MLYLVLRAKYSLLAWYGTRISLIGFPAEAFGRRVTQGATR